LQRLAVIFRHGTVEVPRRRDSVAARCEVEIRRRVARHRVRVLSIVTAAGFAITEVLGDLHTNRCGSSRSAGAENVDCNVALASPKHGADGCERRDASDFSPELHAKVRSLGHFDV
jgi:hypothetical protein